MALRDFLAWLEPDAIPYPFTRLYALVASTLMVEGYYGRVAAQVLGRVRSGRVLDIGTGPGRLPIAIAAANGAVHVTGLDLSEDMVAVASRLAAKRGVPNVDFRTGSAGELPFGDGEFDLVISTLSFHHWKDPGRALDEACRVLRSGGEAWIYDMPSRPVPNVWGELKRQYGIIAPTFMRLHTITEPFYGETQLRDIAAASRFREFSVDYLLFTYRLRLIK